MKIYMQTEFEDNYLFENSVISKTSYFNYLSEPRGIINLLKHGSRGRSLFTKLRNPEYIHLLYINRDKEYMKFLEDFKKKYHDYDVIVMNPGVDLVHPEFLHKEFPNALKVLHLIDDPHTTYSYSLPFAWAFDAATYVIQGYSADYGLGDILQLAGIKNTKWVPHCITNTLLPKWTSSQLREQLRGRKNKAIYVGGYYRGKQDRLNYLKNKMGKNLEIYGRYPLGGYSFAMLSTLAGHPSTYRVKSISNKYRDKLYEDFAVGINMHLTTPVQELGNSRTYELAYRGVAQLIDTNSLGSVEKILTPGKEVLTYENMDECITLANRLFKDENLRISLALNAYERACEEYQYKNVLLDEIAWFKDLIKIKGDSNYVE